ncbi:PPE domain-containing protein [Amycolatopsis sp. NPDC059021]|uniref:PPE domain-containing protein n=1 Tax=Amycolatopsis sp. NPDC059021 TaxID=3346704 RepID=UPI00366F06A8
MFLIPIVAGFSAYNMATTHSNNYESAQGDRKINCYDIWEKIYTGPGPKSIEDGQGAANRLKGSYQDRLTTIDQLAKEMDAAWTGQGSEAAQQAGAHPLRTWMDDSGKKLTDSDKYLGEQHTAFTTVRAKVVQVPKDPPKNNLLNSITPWTTDTDRAIRDYNRNGQANVDAFNEYFKASNTNGQKMPTYSALEGQQRNVKVDPGKDDGKKKPGDDGKNPPGGINVPPGGSVPPGGMPPGGIGVPPGGTPNIPGGGFKPGDMPKIPGSDYQRPDIPGYKPNIPGGDYQPPKVPSWDDHTGASGFTPPKIPGSNFGGGGGGFGPGGTGGVDIPGGGFGPGGSDSGFGPGGVGFGPGGSASGAAIPGSGAAGAGAGGGAAGAGAAGAAGAGRGATGMGGMGGMGHGAKGKGGEDEERSSKFLLGDDPNEIFGTDELTAPPVIGE